MANAKSSIILDEGLNSVHNGVVGSYFSLKYWLPIYDPRIDNEIHSETQTSTSGNGVEVYPLELTLSATHNYVDLEGEKLFNAESSEYRTFLGITSAVDVYSLPDTSNYVISGSPNIDSVANSYSGSVSSTSTTITNSSQRNGVKANLINSTSAMSQVLSATTLSVDSNGNYSGTGIAQIPQITEINYALTGGSNVSAVGLLYPVNSFSSMVVSGNNVDAGRYNVRLEAHGDFRFNKFILFVAKMNADGTEDTTYLPVPFSVSVFEGTTEKVRTTSDGTGLQWEGIVQLAFQRDPAQNNLTNLIIDTWTDLDLSAFTIATNKKVHIFDTGSDVTPVSAKLTVTDDTISQLSLNYNLTTSGSFKTDVNGLLHLNATSAVVLDNDLYTSDNNSLHINYDRGGVASTYANDLVIKESSLNSYVGISLLNQAGNEASIYFGNSSVNNIFSMTVDSSTSAFTIKTGGTTLMELTSTLTTFDNIVTIDNDANALKPLQILNNPVSETPSIQADLFINNGTDTNVSIVMIGTSASNAIINFGDEDNSVMAYFKYAHSTDTLSMFINFVETFTQTSALTTFNTAMYIEAAYTPLLINCWFNNKLSIGAYGGDNTYITLSASTGDSFYFTGGNGTLFNHLVQIDAPTNLNGIVTFDDDLYLNGLTYLYGSSDIVLSATSDIFIYGNDTLTLGWPFAASLYLSTSATIMNQPDSCLYINNSTSEPPIVHSSYGGIFTSADPSDSNNIHLFFVDGDGNYHRLDMTAV